LARAAGVAASTITRKLNDPNDTSVLNDLNVARICAYLKIKPPNFLDDLSPGETSSMRDREREAEAYTARPDDTLAEYVAIATAGAGKAAWMLRSRALEYEGFRIGDILIVDRATEPRPGDIVLAQLLGWQTASDPQAVFRVYEPPFLIAAGPDETARKPLLVDNQAVTIQGVVMQSFRPRPGRNA
jgi:hypothetical protein